MGRHRAWLLLVLALLPACSRLSLAWNFAPWYLEKKAAVFLDVPEQDRDAFGRDVEALLQQMAREQGPGLSALALGLGAAVESGDKHKTLELIFKGLPVQWDALAEPAVAPCASWLLRKDAEGLRDLEAAFVRIAQEEEARRARTPSLEKRVQRLRGNLKEWLGSLNQEQERQLAAWSASMAFPRGLGYADRIRRRARLLEALRGGKGQAAVEAQLRLWWIDPEKDREPAYTKAMTAYRLNLERVSAELFLSLDLGQRTHLSDRLKGYGHDLAKIAELPRK